MHDELFGQRLRAERERRRITLESIAANTKISIGLLRDLEADRLGHWPGGIFRRSFVRSYATAVGLDPDETLAEFLQRHPEPLPVSTDAAPPPSPRDVPRRRALPVLRLTLADEPHVFTAGPVLMDARRRLLAAACDLGAPLMLAGLAYLVSGTFWAVFAMTLVTYLAIGILALGNTPGIYLCAPGKWPTAPPPQGDADDPGHLTIFEKSLIR